MTIKELIKLFNNEGIEGYARVVDIKYINEGEDVEIIFDADILFVIV